MAIIELSYAELSTLNFCLSIAEITAKTQKIPSFEKKIKPLRAKIITTINNNYNDRKENTDGNTDDM
tara:strand:- start:223 stop:423 length:201 start_codon:yes stop_codon:yes gene_type:complete